MASYTVHSRTRYGVYRLVGTFPTRHDAFKSLVNEVAKGVMAYVWIRFFEDCMKIYEWDHAHDTLIDAQNAILSAKY